MRRAGGSARKALATLEGHGDSALTVTFSPDGARIVTASLDKTARLWDGRTGKALTTLEGHGDSVLTAAFSPDGARIVTASSDKTAAVDGRTGKRLRSLATRLRRRWQQAGVGLSSQRAASLVHCSTARL